MPEYRIVEVGGEAHAQTFLAECRIAALDVATRGQGGSRRAAEQAAAQAAYVAANAGARP